MVEVIIHEVFLKAQKSKRSKKKKKKKNKQKQVKKEFERSDVQSVTRSDSNTMAGKEVKNILELIAINIDPSLLLSDNAKRINFSFREIEFK